MQGCLGAGPPFTDKFAYEPSDNISTDARRRPLCDKDHAVELPLDMRGGVDLLPLTDQAILLLGTGKFSDHIRGIGRGIDLVRPDGQLLFHRQLPKHDYVGVYYPPEPTRSDQYGDRFGFMIETWRGVPGSDFLAAHMVARRVVVLDQTGKELGAIPVSTTYHRDFDFSLSPDGHRLAILDEGVLTIVELP